MSLTDEEKSKLTAALGTTSSIMAYSVAQLFLASPDPTKSRNSPTAESVLNTFPNLSDKEWTNTGVMGALLFVIDRAIDTFVFQIYDLESNELRFEYELYEDCETDQSHPQFVAFEMEDCVAGFCFASEIECRRFMSKVRALRPSAKSSAPVNMLKDGARKKAKKGVMGKLNKWFGGSGKHSNRREFSIGEVTKVVHNAHIGLNADGSFDTQNIPHEWKALFRRAGIRKKDLKDSATAKAILEVVMDVAGPEDDLPTAEEAAAAAAEEAALAEQIRQYEEYQRQLEEYERALAKYEEDKAAYEAAEAERLEAVGAIAAGREAPPVPSRQPSTTGTFDAGDIPPPPPTEAMAAAAAAAAEATPSIAEAPPEKQAPPPAPPPPKPMGAAAKVAMAAGMSLTEQIAMIKLKKAQIAQDASAPDLTGHRGRSKTRNFLGDIEGGVKLKKTGGPALPDLKKLGAKEQNSLMANLVNTMNARRAVIEQDDEDEDDDDGWSDDDS